MASPFCEKYWSWFKEKQAEGFEIISFALRRPPFTTLPLEQIEFAGKVNVGVVLQDYLVFSTPINWPAMCVSSRGVVYINTRAGVLEFWESWSFVVNLK